MKRAHTIIVEVILLALLAATGATPEMAAALQPLPTAQSPRPQRHVISADTTSAPAAASTIYYVSSAGDDDNDGLSEATPFETIAKVNGLDLQPGDQVLFKCGNVWRTEQLILARSGTESDPITFGSYPADCANQPVLSGAQPISGWSTHSGNVYVADLSAGENAGTFAYGVNQLFDENGRLPMGRWPNLDAGNGGYATIDGQPAGDRITDLQLPAGDWTGAVAHIRGMTWYILNREVTSDSGSTLTLNTSADCWGECTGWGYFLNQHLDTLDREGEWYYDAATQRVYLYTTGGAPADAQIEGSVVLKDDDRSWGGVMLGVDLNEPGISHVVVENLDVRRWFRHGIATPTNHAHYENHHVTLRDNTISDVDDTGINLAAWVWDADDGRSSGWRGGYAMTVEGNVIDTANSMGINTYARNSTFSDNVIRDVGRIENLGAAGLGCSVTHGGGRCTEDGDGIRIKVGKAADTGNYNTVTGNRLERIAYNGVDVFGYHNTFEHNVIHDACYTKADCGSVRTFGSDSLSQTSVHDLTFRENVFVNAIGNMDGCKPDVGVRAFGFYIDHYSRDVRLIDNTVISATVHGVLYQNSTGSVTGNTLYNNGRAWDYAAQFRLGSSPAAVSAHTGNVLYGLRPTVRTLALHDPNRLGTSDDNYFFNPYNSDHIHADGGRSLASWQSYSGKDGNSKEHGFTLEEGDPPHSRIFYNDTPHTQSYELGLRQYRDLDQNVVVGSVTLQPFTSLVLVDDGEVGLALLSMTPRLWGVDEAADFTLAVHGTGFTESSVVRWNGADRPTGFVSHATLTATISATDVSTVTDVPVTVHDPGTTPTETQSLTFRVVASVARIYLPLIARKG